MQYVIGCYKKGHIEANCKARQEKEELKWVDKQGEDDIKSHEYHVIDTLCEGTMGSLFKSQGTSETSAYMVMIEVNGEILMMEIDTGAAVTIISEETYREKIPKLLLTESALKLATYSSGHKKVYIFDYDVVVRVRYY